MAETRTAEAVRREIRGEREELVRALDLLRVETTAAGARLRRRLRRGLSLLAAAAGVATVATVVLRRVRRD
jgi:hypothetical protein